MLLTKMVKKRAPTWLSSCIGSASGKNNKYVFSTLLLSSFSNNNSNNNNINNLNTPMFFSTLDNNSSTTKVILPTKEADWNVDLNNPHMKELSPEAQQLEGKIRNVTLEKMTNAELELGGEMYRQATTAEHLSARACDLLQLLKGTHMELGFPVDLYTHSVQSATRAYKDNAGDEMIVCALLHDIGEMLCPSNHGDVAAAILRPYISQKMHWVLANHEIFQGYYYFDKVGLDKDCRDQFKHDIGGCNNSGVPIKSAAEDEVEVKQIINKAPEGAYDLCVEFCEKYDMNSFDPDYESMELDEFQPMLLNVFGKTPWWDQPENLKSGAVTGAI